MRRPLLAGSVAWNGLPRSRAGQQCLRLRSAGKESPQNIFDWASDPLAFSQAQQQARFGIGKDDFSGAFKKNENRQAVENLALRIGVRVFVEIQPDGLPGAAGISPPELPDCLNFRPGPGAYRRSRHY